MRRGRVWNDKEERRRTLADRSVCSRRFLQEGLQVREEISWNRSGRIALQVRALLAEYQ